VTFDESDDDVRAAIARRIDDLVEHRDGLADAGSGPR